MLSWRTRIVIGRGEQQTKTSEIRINNGTFQRNSLSNALLTQTTDST